jgi:hypothetical protein
LTQKYRLIDQQACSTLIPFQVCRISYDLRFVCVAPHPLLPSHQTNFVPQKSDFCRNSVLLLACVSLGLRLSSLLERKVEYGSTIPPAWRFQ